MSIAEDCKKVVDDMGSVREAADRIGVSPHLLRSVVSLTKLAPEVKDMVRRGEILQDSAYRLNTIKDERKQVEIAKLLLGLTNHQQRQLVFQAKKLPDSDLVDFRGRLTAKPDKRRVYVAIIPLEEETYEKVQRQSKRLGRPVERLLSDVIARWASKG